MPRQLVTVLVVPWAIALCIETGSSSSTTLRYCHYQNTLFCSAWRDQAVLFNMAEDARTPSFDVSISSVSSAIEISMARGKSGERLRRNGASRVVNRIRGSCSKREQASSLIAQQFDTPVPVPCSLAADAGRSEGGAILVPICGWDTAGNVARKKHGVIGSSRRIQCRRRDCNML